MSLHLTQRLRDVALSSFSGMPDRSRPCGRVADRRLGQRAGRRRSLSSRVDVPKASIVTRQGSRLDPSLTLLAKLQYLHHTFASYVTTNRNI